MVAWLLFKEIVILMLMIFCGFALVKSKLAKSEDSHILSIISIYLITPLVLINAFQVEYSNTIRDGFLFALFIAIIIHIVLLVVTNVLSKFLHFDSVEKSSIIYSNAGNLIIPLVLSMFGREWVIYASAFMLVQQFLFWSHCLSIMTNEKVFNIRKILSNINIIAIFIGVVLFLLQIRLPIILGRTVSSIAAMIGPTSMILLGMIFAGSNWSELLGKKRLYLIVFLKMIVVPGSIVILLKYANLSSLVNNGPTILLISLLATISPTATMVTQLSRLFNRQPSYAAAINLATTTISIITMPILIFLFNI